MSGKSVNGNLAALKFSGAEEGFAGWKDRIVIHLQAKREQRIVEELQANRWKLTVRYEEWLKNLSVVKKSSENSCDMEKTEYDLHLAFVDQQELYIRYLLSLVMPPAYKMYKKSHEPVHVIWEDIEKRFDLNTVAGVVNLIKLFEAAVNNDFKSVSHLFARLKAFKAEANRNSADALKTGLISSNVMMLEILDVLPSHLCGQAINLTPAEFTPDQVEAKLCAIVDSKGKAKIVALDRGMPVNHMQAGARVAKATKSTLRRLERRRLSWISTTIWVS